MDDVEYRNVQEPFSEGARLYVNVLVCVCVLNAAFLIPISHVVIYLICKSNYFWFDDLKGYP